jgi:hypothetical protein
MQEALDRLKPWTGNPVIFHTFDSHGPEAEALAEELGTVDLLLVDGDHSAEGVEADCKLWIPRLRGYAMFHDWGTQSVIDGFKAGTRGEKLRVITFGMQGRRENTAGLLVVQKGQGKFAQ